MPTLNDFAVEYANYIRNNIKNPILSKEIALHIKELSYTQTGKPLSNEDREKILKKIETFLVTNISTESVKNAEDSTNFIAMVQQIRKELNQR
jgi:uncharacterized coiled-coil DUF342 family protein